MLYLRFTYVQGFENPSADSSANTFALYYADWCPHCTEVKPIFENWGAKKGSVQVNGKTVFVKMYEESADKDKMAGKPVRGFPTFLLETTDGQTFEYKGSRSADGYLAFINEKLGGGI